MQTEHGFKACYMGTFLLLVGVHSMVFADLVTDRPDQTESSSTVSPGYIQLEMGWTHSTEGDPVDTKADSFPETLVRVGLVEHLELRFGYDGFLWEDTNTRPKRTHLDGSGDALAGLKWWFWEEQAWRPEAALLVHSSLPAGETDVSSDRFDPDFRLAFSHTLNERLGFAYNVGQAWGTERDSRGDRDTLSVFVYSAALGIALTDKWSGFVEFFGDIPLNATGGPANSMDGGMTYLLKDNLQLDMLAGFGLSEAAADWFLGIGLSLRLPN